MTADEEYRIAAEALAESVLVVGGGRTGESVATQIADGDRKTDTSAPPDMVILAVDASQSDEETALEFPTLPDAAVRIAAVTVPDSPVAGEGAILETLEEQVDTVVLASGSGADDLTALVTTLVSMVRDSGIVNVDLADIETVFRSVELAGLGVGNGPISEPVTAVYNAFESLPRAIETDAASGVIVDVKGPSSMSVANIDEIVSTVRDRVGPDAHVIWGGAVDADTVDRLEIRLVLGGVKNVRVAPGDSCPRCGTSLSAYTLDSRTMVSCDTCGFAGISVRLRE
jgi:cell division protein FtsZ